jgi:hypothetical protein
MEEKLRSILRRTHWSLVLKAFLFAATWLVLPFWLFLLIALYLYFVPFSGAAKVAAPFFVLLILTLFEGQNLFFAIIIGIIFYCIALIKDLLIIDRKSAYEILVLVLSYLLLRTFFIKEGDDFGGLSLMYSFLVAGALSIMISGFIKNFSITDADGAALPEARYFYRAIGGISFLAMWQLLIVGLFLPLDFLYQSAVIFLIAALFIDLVPHYVFGELSRRKAIATSIVVFTLLVIVLASARWIL